MSASDHPETIFMAPNRDYENIWARPTIEDEFCDDPDAVEYIRADLPPTDAQITAHPKVRELVEAVKRADVLLRFMAAGDDDAAQMARHPLDTITNALAAFEKGKP